MIERTYYLEDEIIGKLIRKARSEADEIIDRMTEMCQSEVRNARYNIHLSDGTIISVNEEEKEILDNLVNNYEKEKTL